MSLKPKVTERDRERRTRLIGEVALVLREAPAGSYFSHEDLVAAASHIVRQVQAGKWRAAHDIAVGLHASVMQTTAGVILCNGSGGKVQLTSSSKVTSDLKTRRLDRIVG